MKFLVGEKQNMTQVFGEDGKVYPSTVVLSGPMTIVQVKTKENDGYDAVQIGFGSRKESRVNKSQRAKGTFSKVCEFRVEDPLQYKVGDKIEIDTLSEGDKIEVTSISKGKGFQGVVKRHGFKGGPRTHGQKHSEREPGSIGGGGRAGGRVVKGMRMAGRMGGDTVTVKNLKVVKINKETGEVYIGGALPGRKGTFVKIQVK